MDGWIDGWACVWMAGWIKLQHTQSDKHTEICIHTHMLSFMWSEKKNNMILRLLKINNNVHCLCIYTHLNTGLIHVVTNIVCMYAWMDGWQDGLNCNTHI